MKRQSSPLLWPFACLVCVLVILLGAKNGMSQASSDKIIPLRIATSTPELAVFVKELVGPYGSVLSLQEAGTDSTSYVEEENDRLAIPMAQLVIYDSSTDVWMTEMLITMKQKMDGSEEEFHHILDLAEVDEDGRGEYIIQTLMATDPYFAEIFQQ